MQEGGEVAGDQQDSFLVRMNAVSLVERRIGSDTFEQEGIERDIEASSERGKNSVEPFCVVSTPAGRRFHADENGLDVVLEQSGENGGERLFRGSRLEAAQRVVRAQRDDDNPRLLTQDRHEARGAAEGRIAGDSFVVDGELAVLFLQLLL